MQISLHFFKKSIFFASTFSWAFAFGATEFFMLTPFDKSLSKSMSWHHMLPFQTFSAFAMFFSLNLAGIQFNRLSLVLTGTVERGVFWPVNLRLSLGFSLRKA